MNTNNETKNTSFKDGDWVYDFEYELLKFDEKRLIFQYTDGNKNEYYHHSEFIKLTKSEVLELKLRGLIRTGSPSFLPADWVSKIIFKRSKMKY